MRLVQLYVPRGERASVVATLESEGVDYGLTDETSDRAFEAMNDDPAFDELEFRDAGANYELHDVYADRPARVRIVGDRPPGETESDSFAEQIRDRLATATGTDLVVTVEMVDTQRSQ